MVVLALHMRRRRRVVDDALPRPAGQRDLPPARGMDLMARHGTIARFERHRRDKTLPCLPCSDAWAQYMQDRRMAPVRRAQLAAALGIRLRLPTERPSP